MDEKVYLKFTDGREAFIYKTEKLDIEKELNKLHKENELLKTKLAEKRIESHNSSCVLGEVEKWLNSVSDVLNDALDKLKELKGDVINER